MMGRADVYLKQGFSTGSPWAKSGPPTHLVWPFHHLWNEYIYRLCRKNSESGVYLALKLAYSFELSLALHEI